MKSWAQTMQDLGANSGVIAIQSSNKVQIHNAEKLGWRKIGAVIFITTKIFNYAFVSIGIRKSWLKRIKP